MKFLDDQFVDKNSAGHQFGLALIEGGGGWGGSILGPGGHHTLTVNML